MDPEKVNHHLDATWQMASGSYDAYVHKMIEKIGKPVSGASVRGNPWSGSTLDVTCTDGETQVWSTKMIINVSVLGKLFNQFPSRRIDRPELNQDDDESAALSPSPAD